MQTFTVVLYTASTSSEGLSHGVFESRVCCIVCQCVSCVSEFQHHQLDTGMVDGRLGSADATCTLPHGGRQQEGSCIGSLKSAHLPFHTGCASSSEGVESDGTWTSLGHCKESRTSSKVQDVISTETASMQKMSLLRDSVDQHVAMSPPSAAKSLGVRRLGSKLAS